MISYIRHHHAYFYRWGAELNIISFEVTTDVDKEGDISLLCYLTVVNGQQKLNKTHRKCDTIANQNVQNMGALRPVHSE